MGTSPNAEEVAGAARSLRGILEAIQRGELTASAGMVERLEGATVVLELLADAQRNAGRSDRMEAAER